MVNSIDIGRLGWNIRARGLRLKDLFRLPLAWAGETKKKKRWEFLSAKGPGPTPMCQ